MMFHNVKLDNILSTSRVLRSIYFLFTVLYLNPSCFISVVIEAYAITDGGP